MACVEAHPVFRRKLKGDLCSDSRFSGYSCPIPHNFAQESCEGFLILTHLEWEGSVFGLAMKTNDMNMGMRCCNSEPESWKGCRQRLGR